MANHTAPALLLRAGDQQKLQKLVRSTSGPWGLASRARVVLLASEGVANYEIAGVVGMSRPTVNRWRARYTDRGIDGLADEQRPGRPKTVDEAKVIALCEQRGNVIIDQTSPDRRLLDWKRWTHRWPRGQNVGGQR